MTDNIYSNAFNFSSYQDGKVDMRTGQFSAVVTLVTLRPEGGGATGTRDLTLTFSTAKTTNDGYGIGWSLNVTSFDPVNLILRLATGEQYKANPLPAVGSLLTFQDLKLQNVAVRRTGSTVLTVYCADGIIETLTRPTGSGNYRTTALSFENGESLTYSYTSSGWLSRVAANQTGTLFLDASYLSGTISRVTTVATAGRRAAVGFVSQNGLLTSISMPYDASGSSGAARLYSYKKFANGMYGITQIRNPMGGVDLVTYQERALPYGNNAYLPAVQIWERQPQAGQPSIVTRYAYSPTKNFTGNPIPGGFTPGVDNLYKNSGAYEYWSEARTLDPDNGNATLAVTTTTYNKFHLMTRQVRQQGTATKTTTILYNDQPNVGFSAQPANLQIPRQVTNVYTTSGSSGSRQEVTTTTSDGYGNILSQIDPSGLRMDYDYYPVAGQSGACPAEPNGLFVRFRKTERATPAGGNGTTRQVGTVYIQVPRLDGAGYFVQPRTDTVSNGSVTNYVVGIDSGRPTTYGRLSSLTVVQDGLTTTTGFSYTTTAYDLTETRTITGADRTTSVAIRRFQPATNQLLEVQSSNGNPIVYDHDVAGRVTAETVAPGTAGQARRAYAYSFAQGGTPAQMRTTDAQGKVYATSYDGLGRMVASVEVLNGSTQRQISTTSYDRMGRKVTDTKRDEAGGTSLVLTTRYAYSDWDDVARTTNPDGSVTLSLRDRVANTMTTGTQGLNTTITSFNAFNKPVTVVQVDSNGGRIQTLTRSYDGFGRCTALTDVDGNVTQYSYDAFDRVTAMQAHPADRTAPRSVIISYAPGTSADLRTGITVNGRSLGSRGYDGVGRLVSESLGEGVTTYSYQGSATRPATKVTPRGIRQTFSYDTANDSIAAVALNGVSAASFSYIGTSGQISAANNTTATRARTYDGYQFPSTDVLTAEGTPATTRYTHSPAGRLTRLDAPTGDAETRSYDSVGRLSRISNGSCTIDHGYDGYGRLVSTTVSDGGISLSTTVTFDSYGREATRSFRVGGSMMRSVTRSYARNGNLVRRLTTDGGGGTLSDERFTYDAYSRLISYSCSGSQHPCDNLGRALAAQSYVYDAFDNLTQCTSTFTTGQSDVCTRSFGAANPTRLTAIATSNPSSYRVPVYDQSGNLVDDQAGRSFTYDGLDRLTACSTTGGYGYDAEGRLVVQTATAATPLRLHYADGSGLIAETQGDAAIRYRRDGAQTQGRSRRPSGGAATSEADLLDAAGSVIGVLGASGAPSNLLYTPYGQSGPAGVGPGTPLIDQGRIGFNGERLDAMAGLYHLGNGRRPYSPDLMMFLTPDPMAVFGGAGYNAYGYCRGDPVNLSDPSGLLSSGWSLGLAILGFVLAVALVVAAIPTGGASLSGLALVGMIGASLGVVSAELGLASAIMGVVDEKNGWDRSDTIRKLNIASLAFGVASMATSGFAAAANAYKAARTTTLTLATAEEAAGITARDIQLADLTGAAVFNSVTTNAERVAAAGGAAAKTFFGIDSRIWATGVGVSNVLLGSYFVVSGSIDLANPSGGAATSGGANGNGQTEAALRAPSGNAPASMEPYRPAVRVYEDSLASRQDYDQEFQRQAHRVRRSFSADLGMAG